MKGYNTIDFLLVPILLGALTIAWLALVVWGVRALWRRITSRGVDLLGVLRTQAIGVCIVMACWIVGYLVLAVGSR